MSRLLTLASGRRAKWVVGAVWLVVIMAMGAANLPAKFADAQQNESSSFLPGDAESTKALTAAENLQGGETAASIVIYRRESGLTAADQQRIQDDRARYNADLPRATGPLGEPIFSPDGKAAIVQSVITGDGESDTILDPVDKLRDQVSDPGGGLFVKVTGPAGYSADAIKIFESINGTLLLAALALVIVLLILIYRSPIFLFIPLIAVVFAEIAAQGIGYGLTQLGVTVNGQSSSILDVLVLGAGTDYALLLVARYREELRKHEDKHEALALALRTAGPAIVASGTTVICALLTLSIAEVNATSGLGPIGAMGIAVAMLAMLTLLPAMLVITGRWAFWRPAILGWGNGIPHLGDTGADETHGAWRRAGERVARSPRRIWITTSAILVVCCFGVLNFSTGLNNGNGYRGEVESVEGQALLAKSFPSGNTAPVDIVVPDAARAQAVAAAAGEVPGVVAVAPAKRGEGGVLLNATLEPDPFSREAEAIIEPLRAAVKEAGGQQTLVGGQTAIQLDGRQAATRDTLKIVPITLVIVLLILILLLRAVVAPLLLIGTVILSFGASLGVSSVVYDVVFGFPGSDPSLPLYAFVFLVALGIDYNIFLMARVREETLHHGTAKGMIRGLAVTGGVITSAGIVLAGTFSVLGVLPLVFLTEIGFLVAFGVLLDTFVVRSVLVPALVLDTGPRVWWPSELARTDGAHEPEPELERESAPV
ncbi:MAG TPA: MMPL family transporter [Solirubrobacteraceae bacterium]|nr:MMPL family transporter [Solirubrobacteraceae bacterium]